MFPCPSSVHIQNPRGTVDFCLLLTKCVNLDLQCRTSSNNQISKPCQIWQQSKIGRIMQIVHRILITGAWNSDLGDTVSGVGKQWRTEYLIKTWLLKVVWVLLTCRLDSCCAHWAKASSTEDGKNDVNCIQRGNIEIKCRRSALKIFCICITPYLREKDVIGGNFSHLS